MTMTTRSLISYLDLDLALKRVRRNLLRESFPNRLDLLLVNRSGSEVTKRAEELLADESFDWANGSANFFDMPRGENSSVPFATSTPM